MTIAVKRLGTDVQIRLSNKLMTIMKLINVDLIIQFELWHKIGSILDLFMILFRLKFVHEVLN